MKRIVRLVVNPVVCVLGSALCGAACVIGGVALLTGAGWALVTAGVLLFAAAGYITKGLKPNG